MQHVPTFSRCLCIFFFAVSLSLNTYTVGCRLSPHTHTLWAAGGLVTTHWFPPRLQKNLKILSFTTSLISQPARPQSSRVSSKAFSLSLSLSSVCLPPPLSLSHLSLSLDSFFCLPLFILPPSPCHFSILCLALISRLDFLIHEGFRFALLSAVSACRGDSLCSNGSILSVWQTSGITCHFIKWLLVRSSNTEAVWIELEIYSMSLLLLLLFFFGELIWRITFLFLRKLCSVERFRPARGLDDWKILNSEATKYWNCVGADAGVEITAFNKWEKKKIHIFFRKTYERFNLIVIMQHTKNTKNMIYINERINNLIIKINYFHSGGWAQESLSLSSFKVPKRQTGILSAKARFIFSSFTANLHLLFCCSIHTQTGRVYLSFFFFFFG